MAFHPPLAAAPAKPDSHRWSQKLAAVPGLEAALAAVRELPAARYTEDDWQIVRSCFTLLRRARAN
jgi:hypothetical protein